MILWIIKATWRGIFGPPHRHHFRPRRGRPHWFVGVPPPDVPLSYECRCGEWLHITPKGWFSRTDYRKEQEQLRKRLDRLETGG